MRVLDWDIMKNGAVELIKKRIVIYGISSSGERIIEYLKFLNIRESIIYACDTDEKKLDNLGEEGKWKGLKVISPIKICRLSLKNIIIIIASSYVTDIYNYLLEIECPYDIVGSKSYMHAIHYDIMNGSAQYFPKEIIERYKNIYEIWAQSNKQYFNTLKENARYRVMQFLLTKETCILVHSIQKTGNKTLEKSLNKYSNAVWSRHLIGIGEKEKKLLSKIIRNTYSNIKILSGIRYPIERIIATKWQYMDKIWVYGDRCISNKINKTITSMPDIREYISHDKWFKEQIEEPFGIDVFKYKFNIDKGYTIINKDNISIFLYRLDYLNKLEDEINSFIGYKDFKIINNNQAKEKAYALAYREFLKKVEIDLEFFEEIVSSKEMQHFFSGSERENYYKKWKPYLK